jgi:hypothetical protein
MANFRRFLFRANERALLFNLLADVKSGQTKHRKSRFSSHDLAQRAALLKIARAACSFSVVCIPSWLLLSEKNGKLKRMSNSRDLNRRFLQLARTEIST